jgi:hypothetical protein
MSQLKYSIVIPSYRGFEGLKIIIPYILSIDRDDIEVIVSINHSEDANLSKKFLQSLFDKRLKIFTPNKKLPHSAHLDFAYSKSTGLWVGHLGDDDLILKNRFDYMDKYSDNCDIIIGKSIRYVWPENNFEPSNSTNSKLDFSYKINEVSGFEYYCKLLNEIGIVAGGQWMCKRSVYQKVCEKFGFFSPPNANVEFFSLRAAARYSRKITLIDYPMFICGRMNKSSGNTLGELNEKIFDWSFENPGWFDKANMPCANYITISYDAALRVAEKCGEIKKYIKKTLWARYFIGNFFSKYKGSDMHNKTCNNLFYLISIIKNFHFYLIIAIINIFISRLKRIFLPKEKYEIRMHINLQTNGVNSITEFADYLKKKIDKENIN